MYVSTFILRKNSGQVKFAAIKTYCVLTLFSLHHPMKISLSSAVLVAAIWSSTLWSQEQRAFNDSLIIKNETIEYSAGNCGIPETGCLNISLHFPLIQGCQSKVCSKINQTIYSKLIGFFTPQLEPLAPDSPGLRLALHQFAAEWEEANFRQSDGSNWLIWIDGQVTYQDDKFLVMCLYSRTVTGDFVSEDKISTLNFALKSGSLIALSDIVADSTALKLLLLDKIQKAYPDQQRVMANYNADQISLPVNFELRSSGIYLWLNALELPMVAKGPVSIFFTNEELRKVFRRGKYF